MSDTLTAYRAASDYRQTLFDRAHEASQWLANAAQTLKKSPADWRFWTENEGYRNCDQPDGKSSPAVIDYTEWPSPGFLVALHLNFLEADRRLRSAYDNLTDHERRTVPAPQ